jgi:hypothetical protein
MPAKHAKYPMTATRMRRDALHLKRIVADLTRFVAAARKDYSDADLRNKVRDYACEVERLATCLRADALDVQSAANDDGYGW